MSQSLAPPGLKNGTSTPILTVCEPALWVPTPLSASDWRRVSGVRPLALQNNSHREWFGIQQFSNRPAEECYGQGTSFHTGGEIPWWSNAPAVDRFRDRDARSLGAARGPRASSFVAELRPDRVSLPTLPEMPELLRLWMPQEKV
jgi:hypothetical protein